MKLKHVFISAVLLLQGLVLCAQERVEYAVLRYFLLSGERYKIEVSYEGKIELEVEASSSGYGKWARDYDNIAPALKWIADNRWDIVQFIPPSSVNNSSYFLIKRIKQ